MTAHTPSNPHPRWIHPRLLLLLFLPALPVLLFSDFLPAWAPVGAVIYLVALFILYAFVTGRWIGHTPADLPLILLVLLLPLGLWITADFSVTLSRTYAFIANIAIFIALAAQKDTPLLRWSRWALLLAGLLLALLTLLTTKYAVGKLPLINRDIYSFLPTRINTFWNGKGMNPNLTGGILALFWSPALALLLWGRGWGLRGFAFVALGILSVMIVISQSRGALLGITTAFLVVTSLRDRRWLWAWWGILIVGLIVFSVKPDLRLQDLIGGSEVLGSDPISGRLELWNRAIYMTKDFVFTGVGLGMFEPMMRQLYPTFHISSTASIFHPHNIFLQASTEMGIPGLIALLALYLSLGYVLVRRALHRDNSIYPVLALGLFGSLITYLVHGLFEVITYAPRAAIIVWGLFGLMMAVGLSKQDAC